MKQLMLRGLFLEGVPALRALRNSLAAKPADGDPHFVESIRLEQGVLVSSFDVFDTVICRDVARPVDAFVLIADELVGRGVVQSCEADTWSALRVAVERDLRLRKMHEEVTLQEIADEIGKRLGASAPTVQAMIDIEQDVERKILRPVQRMVDLVARRRLALHRIVFVSDMYLPTDTIRGVLRWHGIAHEDDRVYVSSDLGMTKRSGALFRHVSKDLHVPLTAIQHIGDNPEADFKVPRTLGIRACKFTDTRLTRYEEEIADAPELKGRTRALLAGACRRARLASKCMNRSDSALAMSASGVMAPLMLAWVLWARRQARQTGAKALYYLARDGQTPFRVSTCIEGSGLSGPPLDSRYLYASRQAWHPAAIDGLDEHDRRWMFADHSRSLTLEGLAARCGLDAPALQAVLPPDLTAGAGQVLESAHVEELVRVFRTSERIRSLLNEAAAERRQKVVRYLETQQLGRGDGKVCLIDVGWHGSLQRSLERILKAEGRPLQSHGLYFGLLTTPILSSGSTTTAWFSDRAQSRERDALCAVEVIEQFFEADHGTTIGYDWGRVGEVVPRLLSPSNEAAMHWGLGLQHRTILDVAAGFLEHARGADLEALAQPDTTDLVARLLGLLIHSPTYLEAERLGTFPKARNQNHDDAAELAPVLPLSAAWRCALAIPGTAPVETGWPCGSLVRSDRPRLARLRAERERLSVRRAVRRAQRGATDASAA